MSSRLISPDDIIFISGYYIPERTPFTNHRCAIGKWDEKDFEDSHIDIDIFYYFDSEEDLRSFEETTNRNDTEFVVTNIKWNNRYREILYKILKVKDILPTLIGMDDLLDKLIAERMRND